MGKMRTAIGMMSGTSMDGIDVALVRTDGEGYVERGPGLFYPYKADFRRHLAQAMEDAGNINSREERPGCLANVEEEIVDLHAECLNQFLNGHSIRREAVDLLGFHGQTVLHRPDEGLTVQLGDGERLAALTGIETVYDLRANDMAYGGQGAPLVPVYHRALAGHIDSAVSDCRPVAFVNIGGISNISYIGDSLIAFDCGPGNALIDQWVQRHVGIPHDQGGMIASEGAIDEHLVQRYLTDPFFSKPVPKSADRGDFKLPESTNLAVETVARSLARVTAESIFKSADHLPELPGLWIVCGGGRHNPHIMRDLVALCEDSGSRVVAAEDAGFDGDMMEAEAWGYLAVRSREGLPITFPTTTGVSKPVTGGVIAVKDQIRS